MKFTWSGYWKPTPKEIRKIADSILAAGMTMATYSIFNSHEKLALSVMVACGIAKFVSNFFTSD